MELALIESRATEILSVAGRFSTPTDINSILDLAHNFDQTWRTNIQNVREDSRAVDYLTKLGCLNLAPGTLAYQITDLGRSIVSVEDIRTIRPDWAVEWAELESLREAINETRPTNADSVSELIVTDWRQFALIHLRFHSSLTILTGANGAGKTTLINILGQHFSWPAQLLSGRQGHLQDQDQSREVGFLYYTSGVRTPLIEQPGSGVRNSPLVLPQMQQIPGIFINSHRSISSYQPLTALPPRFSESETLLQQFSSEIQTRYSGGNSQHSPLYRMKEALIAAAMYAYGNAAVRANESARDVWEGYQNVLRRFLPKSMAFQKLLVDDSELIVVTDFTEYPLEAVSGGISAMLELSWQIFLRQRNQEAFTVCLDEPENHLHPELQRSIMPSLLAAFPGVTFIVATHSPLVVTATQDSTIYALESDLDGRFRSRELESLERSATPDETLTSVLGLDSALPIWAESELGTLLSGLGDSPSVEDLRELRTRLQELGLDRQFPAAVRSIGDSGKDD